MDSAVLILAGGMSTRMGGDKARLHWGETTVLGSLVARLRPVCDEVFVVTRPGQLYPEVAAAVVLDLLPDRLSLGGLYSALYHSPARHNFVCACDMPLIVPDLVRHLLVLGRRYEAVVPEVGGHLEPLCAVYRRTCLPVVEAQLRTADLRATSWLARVRTRFVREATLRRSDPALVSFTNLNTWEEYAQLHLREFGKAAPQP